VIQPTDLALLVAFAIGSLPLVVALHELGHLVPALIVSDRPLRLRVGAPAAALATARIGRVTFVLTRRPLRGSGAVSGYGPLRGRAARAVIAGGPVATTLGGLAAAALSTAGSAHDGPQAAQLACWGFMLTSLLALIASGAAIASTGPDGTPYASDGEQLARLAGTAPPPQRPRPQRASLAAPERPERAR
jgi:hypothetical protein